MLESVAVDLATTAVEMALTSAIGPLGVKIVGKLVNKGWQLFEGAGGVYYLKKGACIVRLTTGCFAKGTPLLTPNGWKAIEDFVPGDEILTRDEDDPNAPVHAQVVEAVFHRHTTVFRVVVRGQEVVLTEEHPFFTFRQGWTPAHQLVPGDLILGLENDWVEVEAVENTGRHEIVYNLTVRDSHTFFVGKPEWYFALWVHNTKNYNSYTLGKNLEKYVRARKKGEQAAHIVPSGDWANTNRSDAVKEAIKKSQDKISELLGTGGINSWQNGFWAKAGHEGSHKDKYFLKMWEVLQHAKTPQDALAKLAYLRQLLQSGAYK
jgi:hypothetical protein